MDLEMQRLAFLFFPLTTSPFINEHSPLVSLIISTYLSILDQSFIVIDQGFLLFIPLNCSSTSH